MKSTEYSEKVLNHFRKPRNVGELEGKNVAVGRVGNPVCGDLMEIYIKVEEDKIQDIKFKTFGCGSAIATASMVTELAKGKTVEEAYKITRQDVADELDGLPPIKMHCSNLAADALQDAINNYRAKQDTEIKANVEKKSDIEEIDGKEKFVGKGIYYNANDLSIFKDKRTIVIDRGEESIKTAIALTKYTPRVIFVTSLKDITDANNMKKELKRSDVKILYESKVLEVEGASELEKVRIYDLNEDEEYELFVDAVIILSET